MPHCSDVTRPHITWKDNFKKVNKSWSSCQEHLADGSVERDECTKRIQVRTIPTCVSRKLAHTSLNSSLCATASKHSCPVLSTESVNSTNSPLSSWIRVTRQLLLETVYLRVLLSLRPNGRGMLHTWGSPL